MPIRFNPQDFDSEVPQEGWDEPVREEEKTWKHTILNIGKGIVALMIIAGLLYFSGIYQGTLFQSTPPSAQPRDLPAVVEGETKVLPLSVVNVVGSDTEDAKSEQELRVLTEKASRIWDQARIDLKLESHATLHMEDEKILDLMNNPDFLLRKLPPEKRQGVVVFLVHSLNGINGIAFTGGKTVALAEFTSVYNFRVLAHEVGHILGLDHTRRSDLLMSPEAGTAKITPEQAKTARSRLDILIESP